MPLEGWKQSTDERVISIFTSPYFSVCKDSSKDTRKTVGKMTHRDGAGGHR